MELIVRVSAHLATQDDDERAYHLDNLQVDRQRRQKPSPSPTVRTDLFSVRGRRARKGNGSSWGLNSVAKLQNAVIIVKRLGAELGVHRHPAGLSSRR